MRIKFPDTGSKFHNGPAAQHQHRLALLCECSNVRMVATLRHLHLSTTGYPAPDTGDPALPSYLRKVLTITETALLGLKQGDAVCPEAEAPLIAGWNLMKSFL